MQPAAPLQYVQDASGNLTYSAVPQFGYSQQGGSAYMPTTASSYVAPSAFPPQFTFTVEPGQTSAALGDAQTMPAMEIPQASYQQAGVGSYQGYQQPATFLMPAGETAMQQPSGMQTVQSMVAVAPYPSGQQVDSSVAPSQAPSQALQQSPEKQPTSGKNSSKTSSKKTGSKKDTKKESKPSSKKKKGTCC